jgi:hypothetical protein
VRTDAVMWSVVVICVLSCCLTVFSLAQICQPLGAITPTMRNAVCVTLSRLLSNTLGSTEAALMSVTLPPMSAHASAAPLSLVSDTLTSDIVRTRRCERLLAALLTLTGGSAVEHVRVALTRVTCRRARLVH